MTEEKVEHKQGKPWKIIFKSRVYSEADIERKNFLSENPDAEAKVKFLNGQDHFVVKVRESKKSKEKKEKRDN